MVLILLLAAAAAAVRQGAAQQEDPRARIRTTVELVLVPVTVKDAQGRLVGDIRPEEFRIFEDNVEQRITLFSVEPFPLSAVILLDNDLRQKSAKQVQASLRAIAGGFSESDEMALCRFDVLFQQLSEFTSDGDLFFTQLRRVQLGSSPSGAGSAAMTVPPRVSTAQPPDLQGTKTIATMPLEGSRTKNIDDAVFAAGQLLRHRPRDHRKIIFLISDGQNSWNNSVSFSDVVRLLLSTDISVFSVGIGESPLNRPGNVLGKYARSTGGDVFTASSRSDLEKLYARVTSQARNQYTLGYVPQDTDRRAEYHSIEVRVRRPSLALLAREGYYSAPSP